MTAGASTPHRDGRVARSRLRFVIHLAVAVVVISLLQAFVVRPFRVPSASMEPTLSVGDRLLVERWKPPAAQDIVVFGHGATWDDARLPRSDNLFKSLVRTIGAVTGVGPSNTAFTVKRVIGTPGRTVACCTMQGAVTVDARVVAEPYVVHDFPFQPGRLDCTTRPRSQRCFSALLVPPGRLLVLGDNRTNSDDSVAGCRGSETAGGCATFARRDQTIGVVGARFWPLTRFRVG